MWCVEREEQTLMASGGGVAAAAAEEELFCRAYAAMALPQLYIPSGCSYSGAMRCREMEFVGMSADDIPAANNNKSFITCLFSSF